MNTGQFIEQDQIGKLVLLKASPEDLTGIDEPLLLMSPPENKLLTARVSRRTTTAYQKPLSWLVIVLVLGTALFLLAFVLYYGKR